MSKAERIAAGVGAGATLLGTTLQLRFHFDERDDKLAKITMWGLPLYSRKRAEARAAKKAEQAHLALELDCDECEHFGGRL